MPVVAFIVLSHDYSRASFYCTYAIISIIFFSRKYMLRNKKFTNTPPVWYAVYILRNTDAACFCTLHVHKLHPRSWREMGRTARAMPRKLSPFRFRGVPCFSHTAKSHPMDCDLLRPVQFRLLKLRVSHSCHVEHRAFYVP